MDVKNQIKQTNAKVFGLSNLVNRPQKIIFLFLNQNICYWYSKEPSRWDGSFKHPEQMIKLMDKKIITILPIFFFLTGPVCVYILHNISRKLKWAYTWDFGTYLISALMMWYHRMLVGSCEQADHVRNGQRRVLVSNKNCLLIWIIIIILQNVVIKGFSFIHRR